MFQPFNNPETIGIISSFPSQDGQFDSANAISRYAYSLSKSFPKKQKIVVFCEKRTNLETPYLLAKNILVVPSFKYNSLSFADHLIKNINNFPQVKNILIQFGFSSFGTKKVIPAFVLLLAMLKFSNKNISLVLHQVATDLNNLSGYLGFSKNSWKIKFLNMLLKRFYVLAGIMSNKIIVHDQLLQDRLSNIVIKHSKVFLIPYPISDGKISRLNSKVSGFARKRFGLYKKDTVILVYGYRSWSKGTDWIVQTVAELSKKYPKENLRLLLAGGVNPNESFDKQLKRNIKDAEGSVVAVDFISEKDVRKVFSASDIVVFPYRTRISASGAFNLTLAYKKPFLVSTAFSEGLNLNVEDAIFDFNILCFEERLFGILKDSKIQSKILEFSESAAASKQWKQVASLYLENVKGDNGSGSSVNFNFIPTLTRPVLNG